MLSKADHQRIQAAIEAAEAATMGEIFCVVAHESSPYREVPFAWGAGVALITPVLGLWAGLRPIEHWLGLAGQDWSAVSEGAAAIDLTPVLLGYATIQALLFAATLLIVSVPQVRRLLTPVSVKRDRVHTRALEQFAHRVHATEAQTGILIYASLAERRVEIVADEDIHKRAGDAAWTGAIKAAMGPIKQGDTAAGLIEAIGVCGRVLAKHYPLKGERISPPHGEVWEI